MRHQMTKSIVGCTRREGSTDLAYRHGQMGESTLDTGGKAKCMASGNTVSKTQLPTLMDSTKMASKLHGGARSNARASQTERLTSSITNHTSERRRATLKCLTTRPLTLQLTSTSSLLGYLSKLSQS